MMPDSPYRVLALVGSLRRDSLNRRLAEWAARHAPAGLDVVLHDLHDVPLFNADVEAHGDPRGVRALKEALSSADAVLIVTPEYNGGIPGVLKNALDWASRPPRPLKGLPVAIMGATPGRWGTMRAQEEAHRLARHLGMVPMPAPSVLVSGANVVIADDGSIADEATATRVRDFLAAFLGWISRVGDEQHALVAA